MKRILYLMLLMSLSASTLLYAKKKNNNDYDVYLLIGQSNMAATNKMKLLPSDTTEIIPGVWLLNDKDIPEPAKNPLNRYSSVTSNDGGLGLGTSFGKKISAKTNRKVLLVVNALGGTEIEQWAKDAPNIWRKGSKAYGKKQLYAEAVRRAKEGLKYGKLKGVLWHQGEGNSGSGKVGKYPSQLSELVKNLRKDLNVPNVPFIAGELSYLRGNGTGSTNFNNMIRNIASFIPNSDWVSTEGLSTIEEDQTHFNRESQLILGERYADKILKLTYKITE
ncbi:sialate O-acetylesterase [Bacteroides nordii]|uniref:sialate O-acetylesterase n=1 Tax=Bacteroides nordii TaxID=291645 RepID=UPI00189BB319|nr:sialate O-acetylesterase [Bacteroides nordii]